MKVKNKAQTIQKQMGKRIRANTSTNEKEKEKNARSQGRQGETAKNPRRKITRN